MFPHLSVNSEADVYLRVDQFVTLQHFPQATPLAVDFFSRFCFAKWQRVIVVSLLWVIVRSHLVHPKGNLVSDRVLMGMFVRLRSIGYHSTARCDQICKTHKRRALTHHDCNMICETAMRGAHLLLPLNAHQNPMCSWLFHSSEEYRKHETIDQL